MYQIFLLLTLIGILQCQSILSGYGNSATAKIYPMFNTQGTDSDRNFIATMERNCHILSLPVTTAPITDDSWESWNFCTLLTPPEDQLIDTSVDLTKMFAIKKSGLFVTDANSGGGKTWALLPGLTCVPKRLYAHHYMKTAEAYPDYFPPKTISCLTVICEKDILHGTYKKLVLHPQAITTPIVDGIIFIKTLKDGPHIHVFYWTEDFNLYIYDVKTKTLKAVQDPLTSLIVKALHITAGIVVATRKGGLFLYDDITLTLILTIQKEDGIPLYLGLGTIPTPPPISPEYFCSGLLYVKRNLVQVVRRKKWSHYTILPQKAKWTSINSVLGETGNPLAQVDFGFPILTLGTNIGEVKLSSFAANWLEQWTVSPVVGNASQIHEIQFVFMNNTINLLAATKFGQIFTHKFTTPFRWASPTYKEDVTVYAHNKTTNFVFNEYQIMSGYCFWAGAAALYQYYKKPSEPYLDQFDLAQNFHDPPIDPSINCRATPTECTSADVDYSIPNTFKALNITQNPMGTENVLTAETIRFELNNNRPIGLSVKYFKDGLEVGAHFLVISGYKEDALQTEMFVYLNDPSRTGFDKFWAPRSTLPEIVYTIHKYIIGGYYLTYYDYSQ